VTQIFLELSHRRSHRVGFPDDRDISPQQRRPFAAQSAGQSSDTSTSEHRPPLLIFPKTHHHFGHKIAAGITGRRR
jgi:hypothetical protein